MRKFIRTSEYSDTPTFMSVEVPDACGYRVHVSMGRNVVDTNTLLHERAYHDLWGQRGEFRTARALVRALGIAQDTTNPSAVY